ncbi:MAG TPA: sulfatase-like hydrolase/transferase [Vicinamibacterales bacterium]|nr:sulfatase-like hydrolase/transferase [Vicinamibacterales bacterium]
MTIRRACVAFVTMLAVHACGRRSEPPAPPAQPPSILLVTLDTTRADAIGPEAAGADTPAFTAIAARGTRFRHAYATVPETLPSHSSIMTGLYPAGHGVHENARFLSGAHPVVAERLRQAGYRTSAFVSSFVLARRFGLARGFDVYDDELPASGVERASSATTDRAIADLAQPATAPRFMWVHYFDPHAPYAPPEPFRTQFAQKPYLGEVAAMDRQLGRLIDAFEQQAARLKQPWAMVIAGDHGEGLGDHGELQHGNLLYQATMHVPLVIVGPGVTPGTADEPVSTRRIYHTILDWAGLGSDHTLRSRGEPETVLGEAMKPFLEYGWQPQVMAVRDTTKAIVAGKTEVYDLATDPAEARNLGSGANVPAAMRTPLDDYPVPAPDAARTRDTLSDEAKRSLASLGYVGASSTPTIRKDAPRPADMVHLFETLERASGLFVQEKYGDAIPLFEKIQAADPYNLDAALRLATAHSSLGHDAQALAAFKRAAAIAPRSPDVRVYLGLHYARGKDWQQAVPILEQVVAETPERLPAVEALAVIRERQGRLEDAIALRQKILTLRPPSPSDLVRLGNLAMSAQQTPVAIDAFEKARALDSAGFGHDLELGVLYLAARRFPDARDALDRVPPSHPEYPMALFKRAQVSVLLKEPDSASRIAAARRHANRTTRELIERERLFR